MARKIQVACNGPGKHVNEVDIDACLVKATVYKGPVSGFPERVVLDCRECTLGKVIVTREMVESPER